MNDKYEYLLDMGYSEEEIDEYAQSWNEETISYLADNSANVSVNMQYLSDDFEEDLLLKLPVFYPDTFVMDPVQFKAGFDILKSEFPDSYEFIVSAQFFSYEGADSVYITTNNATSDDNYIPFLQSMANGDSSIQAAIDSLKNPAVRLYKFIVMLNTVPGIDITTADVMEDYLLELESGKWEVLHNTEYLIKQGMSPELIKDLLFCHPLNMILSTEELLAFLIRNFGENYVERMQAESTQDDWLDTLFVCN